jgi:hypothetical protein
MPNKSRETANLVATSGVSTIRDLNATRVNVSGVGTIANGSITNLTGTSSTITTLRSTTGNFTTGNIVTGVTTNFTSTNVVITGVTTVSAGTALLPSISPSGDPNTGVFFPSADHLNFSTGGTSRVQIDSDGDINIDSGTVFVDATNNRLAIGTTTPGTALEVNGTIASKAGNNASKIQLGNDSKWSISTNVIDSIYNDRILLFQSDSSLGTVDWENNAGTGKLMRLDYSGNLLIGTTNEVDTETGVRIKPFYNGGIYVTNNTSDDGARVLMLNRQEGNGTLIEFRRGNNVEGTIVVTDTTVSYNGGHLARWSQLPNNENPSSILKGTVMSNLDEMCEWGNEDNEQLNKTKISDIESDKNVAGLFVSTTFDEIGPLDFLIGMTGDMIIRISEGTTVERGDLLMSAGDGTAKPQGDGYVQDKTIAKVTSTNISCTYDDGSYCVPCVLMAC